MKSIQGYHTVKSLPLQSVFTSWFALNQRIITAWSGHGDVPWWYNERASLSVFAGAVASAGHFAFEEFSKEKATSGNAQKTYRGRIDLYFKINTHEFAAEAKQCWVGCGHNPQKQKKISDSLKLSVQDALKIDKTVGRRLGFVFITPRWKKNLESEITDRISDWTATLEQYEADAYAWFFPKDTRNCEYYDDYIYPGTAILIKQTKTKK